MAPAAKPGVGSAAAIDSRGKVAARSAAACEEEASPSWVARVDGEGEVTGVAAVVAAMAAVATAAVAVAIISIAACVVAVTGASPEEAITEAPPK